ncbi:MAG: hypothetical protein KDH94_06855 [Coxiellaceae bacterium]|nr:hypothetical protein [Coxiellaceae bacterium]
MHKAGRLVFTGKGQRIYLLKNKAKRLVIIDRYQHYDPGAQAGWASGIGPGKWSAISLTASPFLMSCDIKNNAGRYRKVCCKEVLAVRMITRFTRKKDGGFGGWIAENLSCRKLVKEVRSRGFSFKFPTCGE